MINLVDYGGGNMGSISRCLKRLNIPFEKVTNGEDLNISLPTLLPGVGSFGSVMEKLRKRNLDSAIRDSIFKGQPFLGICVGMQVLFEGSEECPLSSGLNVLKGRIKKFNCHKVPQIGWNKLIAVQEGFDSDFAYFVNSYFAEPADRSVIAYEADYSGKFCAGIHYENITAFQFHPEKSSTFGHELIRRWVDAL